MGHTMILVVYMVSAMTKEDNLLSNMLYNNLVANLLIPHTTLMVLR